MTTNPQPTPPAGPIHDIHDEVAKMEQGTELLRCPATGDEIPRPTFADIGALNERIRELESALMFYRNSWHQEQVGEDDVETVPTDALFDDCGALADSVLSRTPPPVDGSGPTAEEMGPVRRAFAKVENLSNEELAKLAGLPHSPTIDEIKLEQIMKDETRRSERIAFVAQAIRNWQIDKEDGRSIEAVMGDAENEFDAMPKSFVMMDGKKHEFETMIIHGIDVRATVMSPYRYSYGLFYEKDNTPIQDTDEIPNGSQLYAIPPAHR